VKIAVEKDIREIDQKAYEKYQMPSIMLMENAGISLAEEVKKCLRPNGKIIVVAGTGNNGGDGLVCARHLFNENHKVVLFLVGNPKKMSEDTTLNYNIIKHLGLMIENINDATGINKLGKYIKKDDIVVDCLFGIGLTRNVDGIYELVIDQINHSDGFIVSCDVPSGVHASEGLIMNVAVKANVTVALCLPKVGNVMYPAASCNGKIVVKAISVPQKLIDEIDISFETISFDMIQKLLPKRNADTHKGVYGKGNLIAGSFGMAGAAILSSKAALRSGIGLLKLIIPDSLHQIVSMSVPEAITLPLTETRRGVIGINQIEKIITTCEKVDVTAIGPGCGQNAEMIEMLRKLITVVDKPLIIDADGLNTLSKHIEILQDKKNQIILTPHPGEMSRLTGLPIDDVTKHPINTARMYAKEWGVILVLKGARTVVALPNGKVFINVNGNPGMATAGSGDVLTGIITSLVAQGLRPEDAAIAGVFIHGYAGDLMAQQRGEYGLIAGDLIEGIILAMKDIVKQL